MRLLTTSLYNFGSFILLSNSVINITCSYSLEATSIISFAELSSIVVRAVVDSATIIESTGGAVFGIYIFTFFSFFLGLSSLDGIFLFNN